MPMTPAERRQMMLSGPIVPTILTLATPNVLNVAMQSLVSISDAFFVGQLGIVDLAALALVFPTQMALGQMSPARWAGASPPPSRGRWDPTTARRPKRRRHMGLPSRSAWPPSSRSCSWASGARSTAPWAAGGAALGRCGRLRQRVVHRLPRALGVELDGVRAARHRRHEDSGYALVAGSALQIPLTGALTLGWFGVPKLGIQGPAMAAVICFTLSALWLLLRLIGPKAALRLNWPVGGFRWRSFKDILRSDSWPASSSS